MKIGILTFHASLNCGSMLQAFALQYILEKKYGQEVEIINYSNFGQRNYYSKWDIFPKPSVWVNDFKLLKYHKTVDRVRADYQSFIDQYLHVTPKVIKHRSGLKDIEKKYDIVIAGGDQVWNVRCRDHDVAYFLSFVKHAIKVAYSPSLGARDINSECLNPRKYERLIKDFDYLSVRELNGQKWLKKLTGLDIPIVADPTLLLSADEWRKALPIKSIDEDFILFYAFSYSQKENNIIMHKLSEKLNMPIYIIDGKSWAVNRLDNYGIKLWPQSGPLAFLNLLASAKLVLVQSFHGIVFSALFHKSFWALRNDVVMNPKDDRAKCILEQTGLIDRYVTYKSLLDLDLMNETNFDHSDSKIKELVDFSFSFIDSFINQNHD